MLLSCKFAAVHHDNRNRCLRQRLLPCSDGIVCVQFGEPGDRLKDAAAGRVVEQIELAVTQVLLLIDGVLLVL